MKQAEAPCAAGALPDELRGWLGAADELHELAACLAAWLTAGKSQNKGSQNRGSSGSSDSSSGSSDSSDSSDGSDGGDGSDGSDGSDDDSPTSSRPYQFWDALLGCARRGTRHLEQGLVFGIWHTMLNSDDADVKLAAAQCYAALLCVPGSTAHRVFQQEAYLCVLDICVPPEAAPTKRKREGFSSSSSSSLSSSSSSTTTATADLTARASLFARILDSLDSFPLRNRHTIKDTLLETITLIVERCAGQPIWGPTFSNIVSRATSQILKPLHGNPLHSAVSLLLGLVPTISGAKTLPPSASSVPSTVHKSHCAALGLAFAIITTMSTTAVAVEGALEEAPQHSQLTASHMVGTRLVLALVKKLCEDAPERAIRRGLVLGAVLHTLEHAQQSDIGLLSSMTKVHALLAKFSRSKSMSQRLFSVEVCVSLIQKSRGGRRPGTLFATIMAHHQ